MGILSLALIFTSNSSNPKQRVKKGGTDASGKDSSPPPSEIGASGLLPSSQEQGTTTTTTSHSPLHVPSHSLNSYQMSRSSSSNAPTSLYLQCEYAVFTRSLAESNIHELIRQPTGVDKNEWIANHIVAFFNHVNALSNAISDVCTLTTCPQMTGPQNSSYYWIDERNKKVKCSAPQYIELSMMFIQKTLADETIFPTRLDHQFPLYFDFVVRKMVRLLYHIVSHFYACHYRQLIELQLNAHLNSLFLHFISFLITSNIISSEYSSVNVLPPPGDKSLSNPGPIDLREFRAELETLDVLYQLLANQWRHSYAQISAQKRKALNH